MYHYIIYINEEYIVLFQKKKIVDKKKKNISSNLL